MKLPYVYLHDMNNMFLCVCVRSQSTLDQRVPTRWMKIIQTVVDYDDISFQMVRYCQFREQNPFIWRDVDWYGMRRVGNLFEGVLYDRPDTGRLLLCRLGKLPPTFVVLVLQL